MEAIAYRLLFFAWSESEILWKAKRVPVSLEWTKEMRSEWVWWCGRASQMGFAIEDYVIRQRNDKDRLCRLPTANLKRRPSIFCALTLKMTASPRESADISDE
jgi:hypothetical protein